MSTTTITASGTTTRRHSRIGRAVRLAVATAAIAVVMPATSADAAVSTGGGYFTTSGVCGTDHYRQHEIEIAIQRSGPTVRNAHVRFHIQENGQAWQTPTEWELAPPSGAYQRFNPWNFNPEVDEYYRVYVEFAVPNGRGGWTKMGEVITNMVTRYPNGGERRFNGGWCYVS